MKTTVSVLLALALLISAVPFIAAADSEPTAYETILAGLYLQEEEIDISSFGLSSIELHSLLDGIYKNEPMLYYWSGRYSYTYFTEGMPVEMFPDYSMTAEERAEADGYINSVLDYVVSTLPIGIDDYEKALYLHDYVCLNYEYDNSLSSANVYDVLLSGKAICTGYTLLYDELLARVGIESRAVVSPQNSLNHMWNQVLLYGEWYHIDTTWDDPLPDRFGEARHGNFLLSDSEIKKTHNCDYIAENACACDVFDNMPWHSYNSAFVFSWGDIYALDYDTVVKIDLLSQDSTAAFTPADSVWMAIDGGYLGYCVGLGGFQDRFYYNDKNAIYYSDPSGNNRKQLLAISEDEGMIIGAYIFGDTLYYLTTPTGYREQGTVKSVKLEYIEEVGGDANGDGTLDQFDYIFVKRIYFDTITVFQFDKARADVNKDKTLDQFDYILVKRAYFGTYSFE